MKRQTINLDAMLIGAFLAFASRAHAQTISPTVVPTVALFKGSNGLVDTYSGLVTPFASFAPPKGSVADRWVGNWSLKFDGGAFTGTEYKLNEAIVEGKLSWAVTSRLSFGFGFEQPGDINAFSLSQLNLKQAGWIVEVSYGI